MSKMSKVSKNSRYPIDKLPINLEIRYEEETHMIVDPKKGDLYVNDTQNNKIYSFNQNGKGISILEPLYDPVPAPNQMLLGKTCIDKDGFLYVIDESSNNIRKFKNGIEIKSKPFPMKFTNTTKSIYITNDLDLFLIDMTHQTIRKFNTVTGIEEKLNGWPLKTVNTPVYGVVDKRAFYHYISSYDWKNSKYVIDVYDFYGKKIVNPKHFNPTMTTPKIAIDPFDFLYTLSVDKTKQTSSVEMLSFERPLYELDRTKLNFNYVINDFTIFLSSISPYNTFLYCTSVINMNKFPLRTLAIRKYDFLNKKEIILPISTNSSKSKFGAKNNNCNTVIIIILFVILLYLCLKKSKKLSFGGKRK